MAQKLKKQRQQRTIPSEAPEHGHGLADAHVVVVEVAEAGEGQGRQDVQPHVGHFNGHLSVHIVCDHLAQTPKQREKSSNQQITTEIQPLCVLILSVRFFIIPYCHQPFLKDAQFPLRKRRNLLQKQNKTFHRFYWKCTDWLRIFLRKPRCADHSSPDNRIHGICLLIWLPRTGKEENQGNIWDQPLSQRHTLPFRLGEWQPKKSAYFQVFSTSGSELLSRFELSSNTRHGMLVLGKSSWSEQGKVQESLSQIPKNSKTEV